MDSGELAKWVSNASFATLTLIYSFTQLLDLANQFSTLAGVTLRVGQLLQVSSTFCRAFCQQSMIVQHNFENDLSKPEGAWPGRECKDMPASATIQACHTSCQLA